MNSAARIIFSEEVAEFINSRADYFCAVSGETLARRWYLAIEDTLNVLVTVPAQGRVYQHLAPPFEFLRSTPVSTFPKYLLFHRYLEDSKELHVFQVVHGSRNIERVLNLKPV